MTPEGSLFLLSRAMDDAREVLPLRRAPHGAVPCEISAIGSEPADPRGVELVT